MSHIAHLPPSINSTFVTDQFIVCTFLPRPLEEPETALKVPFFHSNIDYDEVIFYHAGDFFSRDNMAAGYITLHPRGINHGPHPKALANQSKAKRTNEIAVMVDTVKPLKASSLARSLELQNYWKSWQS
jgi:homogentisate 1,2-dioxygenase